MGEKKWGVGKAGNSKLSGKIGSYFFCTSIPTEVGRRVVGPNE